MAIERAQRHAHEAVLGSIENAVASAAWDARLAVVELVDGLLADLPSERTVERLIEVLAILANDSKWEVRRAVVPVLVSARRPAATRVIEQLTRDHNQWVRQAAERAKRKLARITTPAEKQDKRARFAFEAIKELDSRSAPRIYQAAMRVGEQYYEELAGDTAHELNTYRASMEGLLQELEVRMAAESRIAPEVSEILGKLRGRSRYLKALVSSLLEYSRDAEPDFQVHSLRPILLEAAELAREKVGTEGDDAEAAITISPEIQVDVCRERLLQALVNIISNAFQALAGKDGEQRVVVEAQVNSGSDTLILTIVDTGSGMDPLQVENATKRFRSLRKEKGGIGLGLPLAVKIIEREHDGRLDIESSVGVGTTVTIELPLKRKGGA